VYNTSSDYSSSAVTVLVKLLPHLDSCTLNTDTWWCWRKIVFGKWDWGNWSWCGISRLCRVCRRLGTSIWAYDDTFITIENGRHHQTNWRSMHYHGKLSPYCL